jgi:hypothetical protein
MCKYERIGTYQISVVFDLFNEEYFDSTFRNWKQNKKFKIFEDKKVKDSVRYHVFSQKGIICVKCGLVGQYFALEKDKNIQSDKYHFNLYTMKNDQEIMMTVDHIVPASKGGARSLKNLQPMCWLCNNEKGNKCEGEDYNGKII